MKSTTRKLIKNSKLATRTKLSQYGISKDGLNRMQARKLIAKAIRNKRG